jgi:hypothetical protein
LPRLAANTVDQPFREHERPPDLSRRAKYRPCPTLPRDSVPSRKTGWDVRRCTCGYGIWNMRRPGCATNLPRRVPRRHTREGNAPGTTWMATTIVLRRLHRGGLVRDTTSVRSSVIQESDVCSAHLTALSCATPAFATRASDKNTRRCGPASSSPCSTGSRGVTLCSL